MNPTSSQTVAREYNLLALTSSGSGMPKETLRFGSSGAIKSITADNGSNCDMAVYIDRDPAGQPSFVVPAGTYKTSPISAQIVGVAFAAPAGDQPRGQAYVHCTDQTLSASSGVSASANVTAVWDSSAWDTGAKPGP